MRGSPKWAKKKNNNCWNTWLYKSISQRQKEKSIGEPEKQSESNTIFTSIFDILPTTTLIRIYTRGRNCWYASIKERETHNWSWNNLKLTEIMINEIIVSMTLLLFQFQSLVFIFIYHYFCQFQVMGHCRLTARRSEIWFRVRAFLCGSFLSRLWHKTWKIMFLNLNHFF